MTPELDSLLWHWHWRPGVALVIAGLAALYGRGWLRLRRRGHRALAPAWRLGLYAGGLASLALALLSPIDYLAERLFAAHMVQHQLLLMVAPPLLLLANPVPLGLWGLPRGLRRAVGGSLARAGAVRRVLRVLTQMPVAGLAYTAVLWGWHVPAMYEAALSRHLVHDLEHLSFSAAALLFWWPVVNPAPRFWPARGGLYYGLRIGYLILATAQNTLLGAVIGLTERVLYPSYAVGSGLSGLFGLSPLDDQGLGGGIMWSASHMYLVAILVLVGRAMDSEGRERRVEPRVTQERAPH